MKNTEQHICGECSHFHDAIGLEVWCDNEVENVDSNTPVCEKFKEKLMKSIVNPQITDAVTQSRQSTLLTFKEFCRCVADGVEIDVRTKNPQSFWNMLDVNDPKACTFDADHNEYRRTPTSTYVPWTYETCPPVLSILYNTERNPCAITQITKLGLYVGGSTFATFQELLNTEWTYNKRPCGTMSIVYR